MNTTKKALELLAQFELAMPNSSEDERVEAAYRMCDVIIDELKAEDVYGYGMTAWEDVKDFLETNLWHGSKSIEQTIKYKSTYPCRIKNAQ